MTKKASIAIICIVCVIALFFGVCSCLPDGLEYGDYNVYHAPINLLQGSSLFSDSIQTVYKAKLNEDATAQDLAKVVRERLGNMYGRWFASVTVDGTDITVTVPVTANTEKTSARSILSDVTSIGKLEFCSSDSYSASGVVLTHEHIKKNISNQTYSHGSAVYYIANMNLTKEGQEIASEKLSTSTSSPACYVAIDGTVMGYCYYDGNGKLQVYTYARTEAERARLVGFAKSGPLAGTLTSVSTSTAEDNPALKSSGGLIFAIVCAAIVLGSWAFYIVRYRYSAIAAIVGQLITIVAFIMFSGMVLFTYLNIASAIGIILGYCMMSAFTCITFEKIRSYISDKTFASARHRAFAETNVLNLIVHGAVLVVGVILRLIPTGVTIPLGEMLAVWAVLSFITTMLFNRLFTSVVAPLGGDTPANYGSKE